MAPVLVLDAAYRPIKQVSWKKAMIMYFQEKIEIIKEYEDKWINSPNKRFKIPAVVRLIDFVFKFPFGVKLSRTNILIRDNAECQYCSKKLNRKRFTVDHVVPRSKGGKSSWENLVACCSKCNTHKGDKSPKEAGLKLKNIPVQPKVNLFRYIHGETPEPWLDFLNY
jgi:5-methylcytosine-specific restriction endonuclease McrA